MRLLLPIPSAMYTLPSLSNVTSDGRLKDSLECRSGRRERPPPPPPASARPRARGAGRRVDRDWPARRALPDADRFGFSADHRQESSLGIELGQDVRAGVDGPDVILRIDPQLLGEIEPVRALADFLHELAARIELKQARAAMIEGPLVAERRDRMTGSCEDENLPFRIRRDARDFAVRRKRQNVGVRVVVQLGHRLAVSEAPRATRRHSARKQQSLHVAS